jgi:hypothetical protein
MEEHEFYKTEAVGVAEAGMVKLLPSKMSLTWKFVKMLTITLHLSPRPLGFKRHTWVLKF